MKKIILSIFSLIAVICLCACGADKTVLSEKATNYKYTYSVNEEDVFSVYKNGDNYKYVEGEEVKYYHAFEEGSFLYTLTNPGDNQYYTSTKVDTKFYEVSKAIASITKADVANLSSSIIEVIIDESTMLDDQTRLKDAYKAGLVSETDVEVLTSGSKLSSIRMSFDYAGSTTTIKLAFSEYGSAGFTMPHENMVGKTYISYFNDNAPVVTITIKDLGIIQVKLFNNETSVSDYVDYFIYMIKQKLYKGTSVVKVTETVASGSTKSNQAVLMGDKVLSKNYFKLPTTASSLTSRRGVLTLLFTNDDGAKSSEFALNYSDSTALDDKCAIPVGGMISGFEVLDKLQVSANTNIYDIKVSILLNGYTYQVPNFDDVE